MSILISISQKKIPCFWENTLKDLGVKRQYIHKLLLSEREKKNKGSKIMTYEILVKNIQEFLYYSYNVFAILKLCQNKIFLFRQFFPFPWPTNAVNQQVPLTIFPK